MDIQEDIARFERARELVLRYGWNSTAYQVLNPGIDHWFSEHDDALVGYVWRHGVRVTAGAPICTKERLAEVVSEFEAASATAGDCVCYFGANDRLYATLHDSQGHSTIVIGAQPVWKPQDWEAILKRHSSLRAQLNRARNKGVTISEWANEKAHANPELRRCLDEWLQTRALPPMHFMVETETLDRLIDRRVLVAEREGAPVGFLVASPVPDRNGWLIEQTIRGRNAPNGTAELLIDAAMRVLGADGFDYVTLGLAPLSQRSQARTECAPLWLQVVLLWVRAHGRRFYNFDGLDAFKAKFRPHLWEPVYAISNEKRFSVRTLYAIAEAFSSGSPVTAIRRSLLKAVRQEFRWLVHRNHN